MPQFTPGESKAAVATFPVKPAGLPCTAELWLGSDASKVATSGEVPFVSTGAAQSITLPITMPGVEGTYPANLDVFSNGQLIGAYKAIEDVVIAAPLPSIDITEFHYVYQGAYTWRLGTIMLHPYDITHIGFKFINNESFNVDGVSVKFRVTNGGTRELSPPIDAYKRAISQPFEVPPGRYEVWYGFTPVEPYDYTAVAEVYVKGELVATSTLDFYPDWPEPPPDYPTKSKVGLSIASLGAIGFNPAMVLEAPRRSLKLVTTNNLDPWAIRARMTAAGAGVALNLNTFHIVIVPETLDVEEEVDVAICQEYNIRIDRGPISSTIFKDKGTVGLSLVKRRSDVASVELMENLLQLSVGDACLGLGINPNSITFPSNDVFINGRKVAGIEVQPSETIYTGVPLSIYTGRLFCNVDIEPELAEAVLKGKVRASNITSISAELGEPVSERAFRKLLLESLSRRFNLEIHR